MEESKKEVLKEEYEKISAELEGKSMEELQEMENQANQQIHEEQTKEASEYIYNIMELGTQYSDEEFTSILDKIAEENSTAEGSAEYSKKYFNQYHTSEIKLCLLVLRLGYRTFGKDFIANLITKDIDSAKKILEVVTQQYIELTDMINFVNANAENMLNEKRKEENKKSN